MNPEYPKKQWLPYLVATAGIVVSFLLWYLLWHHIQLYFRLLHTFRIYVPWLVLFVGISLSVLIGALMRIVQLDHLRTLILNQMNEDLKNEIRERVDAVDTRQKIEVALLQGQKLQAVGTLAGGIAHDFNNILYAIIGYVEMAKEDVVKDSQTYKNLGKVLEATHRGQELIGRILAFSRKQHHTFDVIHLKSTIEAALSLLRPTIPASVMISFETTTEVSILGNQTQIHQVLVNLINNAVDAMEGEGTIIIQMSNVPAHDPILKRIPDSHGQNYCKLEIKDCGHGMDQPTMERIFEPFFTTKEVGKG